MARSDHRNLTRRERQIMDVIYRRGEATVAEVQQDLPDPPSYSAVRAMLAKLEAKEHLTHTEKGPRYVYAATLSRDAASETALERVVRTFFDDSAKKAMTALLDLRGEELTDEELESLSEMIGKARRKGR